MRNPSQPRLRARVTRARATRTLTTRTLAMRARGIRAHNFKHAILDESGSAILEFIMVAIPLFIPLAFFLQSVESKSQSLVDLNNAARQVARAFTTSPTEELAPIRAHEVLNTYQDEILRVHGSRSTIALSINCQTSPCLSPNAKVSVTLTDQITGVSASADQIVDAWRSTG